ncbi:hypothetical protein DB35_22025 [Streptomyces abyssalis]|uniref:Uncharacterized protein n=1 Tax=Streptomyces abyssalis TaxID=933944 RepID=A0A1E7JU07_9ACTN|nr:hypothetical protein [Streptomyces abyssalis]OEU88884.1 hypothetical protein DB35_22025 [Streptomyces abyssalis]OEU93458.1 hypothetical protein AN215_01120 [Streptomyces abyssalis]OEV05432.1 hypothetical protein AN219_36270 [Streptomyces nanshensis]
MRAIVGLWRWRGNPLCRRSDRREAWLALGAMILVVVVAPLAGWLGASAAHGALMKNAEEQQRGRHQVWATAESVQNRAPLGSDPESGSQQPERRHVVAHWAGPDGSSHKSTVTTQERVQPGERFRIWTDGDGTATRRPMSPETASSQAALAGLAAGAGAVGALEAARRLAMRQLLQRRYALWDAEWSRIGPDWGRTGSNN